MKQPRKIVTEEDTRPHSGPDRCGYCKSKVGDEHEYECVCREKIVRLRVVIEYNALVPESWDKAAIESHRNDSTWCSSNMLAEIADEECLCHLAQFTVLEERP